MIKNIVRIALMIGVISAALWLRGFWGGCLFGFTACLLSLYAYGIWYKNKLESDARKAAENREPE